MEKNKRQDDDTDSTQSRQTEDMTGSYINPSDSQAVGSDKTDESQSQEEGKRQDRSFFSEIGRQSGKAKKRKQGRDRR